MSTREDPEIESIYKAGHAHSHAAGLREVYQAGRADEQAATRQYIPGPTATDKTLGAVKREIKNPGAPASVATDITTAAAPPSSDGPPASSEIHPIGSGPVHDDVGTIGSESLPAVGEETTEAASEAAANTDAGAPPPGQNPPGEHSPSAA